MQGSSLESVAVPALADSLSNAFHKDNMHAVTAATTTSNNTSNPDVGYLDALNPGFRHWLSLGLAFVTATAIRSACFNPRLPIYGESLRQNLAPIERNDIAWSFIAATRVWDLVLFIYIWRREAGGHRRRVDAPLLGAVLSATSRLPLYLLLSHFFLLSYKTLSQVLVTDMFSASAAMWVISKLEAKRPSFYGTPATTSNAGLSKRNKIETVTYGIGLSTLINALYSYVSEHAFMGDFIRQNVLEKEIPAYLSAWKPALAEAMAHPTLAIPIMRSAIEPLSMPEHISHALPLSLLVAALGLIYLPQKSPTNLALLTALVVFPTNALTVYNLLPIHLNAAIAIAAENALRAATAAFLVAWTTEEWRRPYAFRGAGQLTQEGDPSYILKDVSQDGIEEVVIVDKDSVTIRKSLDQ